MNKKSLLYKSHLKGKYLNLILGFLFIVLSVITALNSTAYIYTAIKGATPLNEDLFSKEVGEITLDNSYTPDIRSEKYYLNDYTFKEISHWQNNRYLFTMTPKVETNGYIVLNKEITYGNETLLYPAVKAELATLGGKKILVICDPDTNFKTGDTIQGIICEPAYIMLEEIAKKLGDDEIFTMCEYAVDTRDIDMGNDSFVLATIIITFLIGVFLIVKFILYTINPKFSPTYRQLDKYGIIEDVANDITTQLESEDAEYTKKIITTEDWILKPGAFKIKVEKNPAKGHQFSYTEF